MIAACIVRARLLASRACARLAAVMGDFDGRSAAATGSARYAQRTVPPSRVAAAAPHPSGRPPCRYPAATPLALTVYYDCAAASGLSVSSTGQFD